MTPNEIRKWQRQQKHLNRVITIALILLIIVAAEIYRSRSERREEHTLRTLPSSVFLSLPHPVTEITTTISTASATIVETKKMPSVMPQVVARGSVPPSQKIATRSSPNPPPAPTPVQIIAAPAQTKRSSPTTQKTPAPPVSTHGNTCSSVGWYVQLGAFGRVSIAKNLADRIESKGFSTCVGTLPQNALYRVLVGPVPNRLAANTVTQRIANLTKHQGYPQYWSPVR
ncbi:MAG: SPOR domain-containing protein [Acidithiobacillus sp.]